MDVIWRRLTNYSPKTVNFPRRRSAIQILQAKSRTRGGVVGMCLYLRRDRVGDCADEAAECCLVRSFSQRASLRWRICRICPALIHLRYVAENGTVKDRAAAKAMGTIFNRTEDARARDLCLLALKRIDE